MIEFKTKALYPGHEVGPWVKIVDTKTRLYMDYEFSYCDYKVGGVIYTELCPGFMKAIDKEKFWEKLRD